MKRLVWIPLGFLLMGQATPTATPTPTVPAMCTVTGSVVQADGSPLKNGTITFNSQRIQVINSTVVNPTVVTTNTDPSGNIRAISLPQGLVMQITVCPPATGQGQSSNCAAPYSVFIPFSQTANFGNLSQGVQLSTSNSLNLDYLTVNKGVGIGGVPVAAPTNGATTLLSMGSDSTWPTASYITNGGVYNQANAFNVVNPKLTSGTGLYSAYYADYCDPALGTGCKGPNDFYMVMQANGPGSTIATPLSALIQTTAPAGLGINNLAANSPLALVSSGKITFAANGAERGVFSANGLEVDHLQNDANSGVPTLTNCTGGTLASGSRDSFGWITGFGAACTLNFSRPFTSQSNCVYSDAGQPNLFYGSSQTGSAVTINCVSIPSGAACAAGAAWVEYICTGLS
jgi:hypothetical protein